jgi:DNA polymerase-1
MGDPSDNLPGVPGIGLATAKKLLENRENIAEVLHDAPTCSPARIGQLLLAHAEQLTQTEGLARLRTDAPLPPLPHFATPTAQGLARLRTWFEELEFKSLLARLDKLLAAHEAT